MGAPLLLPNANHQSEGVARHEVSKGATEEIPPPDTVKSYAGTSASPATNPNPADTT